MTFAYRWKRNGVPISGATSTRYNVEKADAGRTITVSVTGRRTGYTTVTETSHGKAIARLLTSTPPPSISGTPRVGRVLAATAGTWYPSPVTIHYQWERNGQAVSGAGNRSYKLSRSDAGSTITVSVTGTRTGYTTVTETSTGKKIS